MIVTVMMYFTDETQKVLLKGAISQRTIITIIRGKN